MITELDVLLAYDQGIAFAYFKHFNDDQLEHIMQICTDMQKVIDTQFEEGDEAGIQAYLESVEMPDIDHSLYYTIGLNNPDSLF